MWFIENFSKVSHYSNRYVWVNVVVDLRHLRQTVYRRVVSNKAQTMVSVEHRLRPETPEVDTVEDVRYSV